MTVYQYPHTIDNGDGERLTFLRRVGDRVEVENFVEPTVGPPMHVHHYQREVLTVQSGRIGYQRVGEPAQYAGPGETVAFEAGEVHRFWNAGTEPLHCRGFIDPVDNIEFFLGELFAMRSERRSRLDSLFRLAYLSVRYRSEFEATVIPTFVRRGVFPLIKALGHLLGRYGRYADAPEPVKRQSAAPRARQVNDGLPSPT